MSGLSSITSVRDYLMDTGEDDEEEAEDEGEEDGDKKEEEEDEEESPGRDFKASNLNVDLSKYDNVPLEDIHLDVRPRIKNIIEELYTEHDWVWPPAPAKDVRKMRFFKRKKKKMLYNKETLDFATFLSIIIGPMELYVAIIFTVMPKTFILAMRECVEITSLIIVVFFVQGFYHIYSGVLGLALRASRPFEIGYVYPHWRFQVACPLLSMFGIFGAMYMTQDWMVEKEMMKHLKGYNFHWYSKHMWDYYQSFMRCCGVQNYKDWKYHGPIMYDEKRQRTLGVPESCCYESNCSLSPNEDNVYSGCFVKTIYAFWTLYIVGAICVAISFVLLCIGHKSIQESSRYSGDPIHKLLFDDRWSKKRLHNRSNRREELFSLLNHYCMILGKELGFEEEVEAAKKENDEREKQDQEMEEETAFYESVDTYAGNSPPTPNSATDVIDDLIHIPRRPIEPLPELPKEKKKEDEGPKNGKNVTKDGAGNEPVEWKPSMNATSDEFPLRSEKSFKMQDQEYTVLPTLIEMDANIKAKMVFQALGDEDKLQNELECGGKSVTEIPKINSFVSSPFHNSSGSITNTHTFNGKVQSKDGVKLNGASPESASSPGGSHDAPLSVRFRETGADSPSSQPYQDTTYTLDSQSVSISSIPSQKSFPPEPLPVRNEYLNLTEPEDFVTPGTVSTTNSSVEDPMEKYITLNDVASTNTIIIPETPLSNLENDQEELLLAELDSESVQRFPDPITNQHVPSDSANLEGSELETSTSEPEPVTSPPQTTDTKRPNQHSSQESILMVVESLLNEDKAQLVSTTTEEVERPRISKIPTHSKTAPAYFKSALEHDQAQIKLSSLRKDQPENMSGLDNVLTSSARTKPLPEKQTPSVAFKELVAALNKSSSLANFQQPENNEKFNLELEKSHEFDGSTQVSSLKGQGQKGKRSGIPMMTSSGGKSPKQSIPVSSKVHFPKRVGENIPPDSDPEGRVSPRPPKESRLPKRSKPMNR
ncbi:unnamed protein product [Allacma fusca]|uniref:Uncharacterized protein n=1 Tax=Allacma fusca TaxID=39272 RepID=A0A8J2J2T1_9HEXA|nr:unnamed protein product [Allacma fusca]